MSTQPSLASQFERNEPTLAGSNSIEDELELQEPNRSITLEDRADEDDTFQLASPRLSIPLEVGDQTGTSIDIGRALDDQPPRRLSRGSFETTRGSDRFDDPSALDLNNVSQPPFEDSVLQIALDADKDHFGVPWRSSNPGLVVT